MNKEDKELEKAFEASPAVEPLKTIVDATELRYLTQIAKRIFVNTGLASFEVEYFETCVTVMGHIDNNTGLMAEVYFNEINNNLIVYQTYKI